MENNIDKIFSFLKKAEKLKSTLRYNKNTSGRNESTADHSWRLALMVPIITKELKMDVDINKSIQIALVHDLAEAITGDIDAIEIAEGRVSKEQKKEGELKAMEQFKQLLPIEDGNNIYSLWQEYENTSTKEGQFVKGLDKVETLLQLAETGYTCYDKPNFIVDYTEEAIKKFPEMEQLLLIIKDALKKEFIKGGFGWEK